MFQPKDVFQITITLGDRSDDGKTDVSLEGFMRLPILGNTALPSVTQNIPVDQVVDMLGVAVAALPPALAAAAKGLLAIIKGVLRH